MKKILIALFAAAFFGLGSFAVIDSTVESVQATTGDDIQHDSTKPANSSLRCKGEPKDCDKADDDYEPGPGGTGG